MDHFGRHACDRGGDLIVIAHRLACRNAHHQKPMRAKPSIAADVALRPVTQVVAQPVDLDRKARLRAKEVKHIAPNGMLATEDRPRRPLRGEGNPAAAHSSGIPALRRAS
jgi:hypothetical protein